MDPKGHSEGLGGWVREVLAEDVVVGLEQQPDYLAPRICVSWGAEDFEVGVGGLVYFLGEFVAPFTEFDVACSASCSAVSASLSSGAPGRRRGSLERGRTVLQPLSQRDLRVFFH